MFGVKTEIKGDKIVIKGLRRMAAEFPHAFDRGLSRSVKGIHREAHDFLSGPGRKDGDIAGGGYPVPIRSGHLRRMLNFLEPNRSKTVNDGDEAITFVAGKHEAIVFNAASYGESVHDGYGSSKGFGPRPFIDDAFEEFNRSVGVTKTIQDEVGKAIRKQGFS
jgi:hypothetical protein